MILALEAGAVALVGCPGRLSRAAAILRREDREASAGCGGGGQGARKVNQIPTDLRGGRISDGSWSALNIEGQRTRVQMEVCISDI